jgi:hypothetical protein
MKFLLSGMVVLLVAGGIWFGHAAWRAHRQLVTLNVREMPLAEVLRKIEWQTWQKIRAEKSLDNVRVSLHVTNKPLPDVLDRLADQVGAHWSTVFAVYDSSSALKKLDATLSGDGQLEPAGWAKVAPALLNEKSPTPQAGEPPPGGGHFVIFRRTKDRTTITESGNGHTEVWSPEELVTESSLLAQLGNKRSQSATARAAAEIAQQVNGRWTTYFAFSKSSVGIGFGGLPSARFGASQMEQGANHRFLRFAPGQTNANLTIPPAINPNDRFANLTVEQRVQLARQHLMLRQAPAENSNHIQFQSSP